MLISKFNRKESDASKKEESSEQARRNKLGGAHEWIKRNTNGDECSS